MSPMIRPLNRRSPAVFCRTLSLLTGFLAASSALAATPVAPRLPLRFEANLGQTDSTVRFLARGGGQSLFLTPQEAVVSLPRRANAPANAPSSVLRMRFEGAHSPRLEGVAPAPGRSHYFRGSDSKRWITNVPQFDRVRYQNLYRGVDAIFYGNDRTLEYDFQLAPGASPSAIALRFDGAKTARLQANGDLKLCTAGGDLVQQAPVAYQTINGQKHLVPASYQVARQGKAFRVGFVLGQYDHSQPLVIDPVLSFSSYLGGSGADYATGVAADGAGNAYITGYTASANFPRAGALQSLTKGGDEVFVSKLNPAGTALVYSTYIGGTASDQATGIAVDAAGNAYVTGRTTSANFPTLAAWQTTKAAGTDAFAFKLNASGSALVYSTFLGGGGTDSGEGIAVDSSGRAAIAGYTDSGGAPFSGGFPTAAALQPTKSGGYDSFALKLNALGNGAVFSTFRGGSGSDLATGVDMDSSGNVYVSGHTNSSNFPVTSGGYRRSLSGTGDAFVYKIAASGASYVYGTYLGGSTLDQGYDVAVDDTGAAYVTGFSNAGDFPTTAGAFRASRQNGFNAFVTKLNPAGSGLAYSTWTGASGDSGNSIAVDSSGRAVVTGYTNGSAMPVTPDAAQSAFGGGYDSFVMQFNATGSALVYSSYLGGAVDDVAKGVALDSDGDAYVVGYTASANLLTTPGAFQKVNGGAMDGFVVKIALSVRLAAPGTPGSLDTRLTLVWRDADNSETGFEIEQSQNGGAWIKIATLPANTTSYVVSNTTPGVSYRFRVRAFNAAGYSPYSNLISDDSGGTPTATPSPTPAPTATPTATPTPTPSSSEIMVDNGGPDFSVTGAWTTSSYGSEFVGDNYLHDGDALKGQKTASFVPTLSDAGNYEVFIQYSGGSNRASNVPVKIVHQGVTSTVTLDQRSNGGTWVSLGTFAFDAGTSGKVLLATTGTDGYVVADAVKFVPVP